MRFDRFDVLLQKIVMSRTLTFTVCRHEEEVDFEGYN